MFIKKKEMQTGRSEGCTLTSRRMKRRFYCISSFCSLYNICQNMQFTP